MHSRSFGWRRALTRKPIAALQEDARSHGLRRSLGPLNLVLLGVGCILGAGIYVLPGAVAANYAGPAVMLSFVLAGAACALTALCYAELASTMPVCGSAYTYCYAAIGEVFAWCIGWLLLLEYGLAAALLAVGFSGYFVSLAADLGWHVPAQLAMPFVQVSSPAQGSALYLSGGVNLLAALAIGAVTAVLVRGVTTSALVNNVLVAIKVFVLVLFVAAGVSFVQPGLWTPFVPESAGGFAYGVPGILRGASILFFAYFGFETVSTAASEAHNPQRDIPIGILGALAVCTVIYIVVSAVLTGLVPYPELGVPDPIAVAVNRLDMPLLAPVVKIGALMGLASVLLVNAYGQSRVSFAISRDGLLPPLFSQLHPRFHSPWLGTLVFGAISALAAALLPLSLLGDLISLGTGLAFCVVCLTVMWLRTTQPQLARPFRVPGGGFRVGRVWIGYVPVAAILLCWTMILPVAIDITAQAMRGHLLPAAILAGYALIGMTVYAGYGLRHSRLAAGARAPETPPAAAVAEVH